MAEPKFTSEPKADLSFFDNYISHCAALIAKHSNNDEHTSPTEDFTTLKDVCVAKLNFFTPLRDRYDFTDEVVGATLLPLAGVVVSAVSTVWALKELFHTLAITINLVNDDGDKHGEAAIVLGAIALFAAVASLAALIKCTLSLLTRPIATLGNALFSSTPENPGQLDLPQSKEEQRFVFNDAQTMRV